MKYILRLSGESPELSILEFEALFKVRPNKTDKQNVFSTDLSLSIDKMRGICESSSMIKKVYFEGPNPLQPPPSLRSSANDTYPTANVAHPCKKVWENKSPQYPGREPKDKPAFHPSMLKPKLARLLVNLARVKPHGKLFDPFCGTGSVLIEAYHLNLKPIGIDVDWKAIKKSEINLKHYKIPAKVKVGDATKLEEQFKPKSIDGIATDLPYGRSSTLAGRDINKLYYEFLNSALKVLKPKRYLVFMKPNKVNNRIPKGYKKIGHGDVYVHGGLTRRVVVLRNDN